MGTFSVEATVANLADPTMRATLGLLVDTGATWTTLPGDVAADIGAAQLGVRRVRLADGRVEEWPAAAIHITLEGHEGPTFWTGSGDRLPHGACGLIGYCGPRNP